MRERLAVMWSICLALATLSAVASPAGAGLWPPVNLSSSPGVEDCDPHVALDEADAINVVWDGAGVRFARSTDAGLTFSNPLTLGVGNSSDVATGPVGVIYVAWRNGPPYLAVSTDGGSSFSSPRPITTAFQTDSRPGIAVGPNGRVHVVWVYSQTVYYARSDDGGHTFTVPIPLNQGAYISAFPDIAVGPSGNPHVVWVQVTPPANGAIGYARSLDGGQTFQPRVEIDDGANHSDLPSIAVDGNGTIHVAWREGAEFAYRRSTDYGQSFSEAKIVIHNPHSIYGANYSAVATSAIGDVYVLGSFYYYDSAYQSTLYLAHSMDSGASFVPEAAVDEPPGYIRVSDVAATAAGTITAVWNEGYPPDLGTFEVFARTIGDVPTPTLISLLSAEARLGLVRLQWYSADMGAATLYRRDDATDWTWLAEIQSDGGGQLTYEDHTVQPGERYGYRLGVLQGGTEEYFAETWVSVPPNLRLALTPPAPNPATSHLAIAFTLSNVGPARLEVLDIEGRRVGLRDVGSLGVGQHTLTFAEARSWGSGIYLVRLTQGAQSLTTRACILR